MFQSLVYFFSFLSFFPFCSLILMLGWVALLKCARANFHNFLKQQRKKKKKGLWGVTILYFVCGSIEQAKGAWGWLPIQYEESMFKRYSTSQIKDVKSLNETLKNNNFMHILKKKKNLFLVNYFVTFLFPLNGSRKFPQPSYQSLLSSCQNVQELFCNLSNF